ncbi:MAG: RluA family pseudouridine synthase [Pirellulales bacterium]
MPSSHQPLHVLYEDNHLLVVNKPAGLATMGVGPDRTSLLDLAKEYIGKKHNKPGNVYLGIVSRLDAPVTGVVITARTSKAASRLSASFRQRTVEKVYWAVVDGQVEPSTVRLEHYLRKDERHRRVHTTHADCPGAQFAWLDYSVLNSNQQYSLLEVRPGTGRKHQIRVQLAAHHCPIAGDRKYGSDTSFPQGIALHARRLSLQHPVRDERMQFEAPLPAAWQKLKLIRTLL